MRECRVFKGTREFWCRRSNPHGPIETVNLWLEVALRSKIEVLTGPRQELMIEQPVVKSTKRIAE